jgi:translocation and assembly module TamB
LKTSPYALNGNLKLNIVENYVNGAGHFFVSNLLTAKNSLKIDCDISNKATKFVAQLLNKTNCIRADISLPVTVKSDGTIIKNNKDSDFYCHIFGNMNLENLFELSDKVDVQGKLNCDLNVQGTLANPTITGQANLQKLYLLINDVALKNGNISLVGRGKNLVVSSARFIDSRRKTLDISGSGELFFNGFMPNIKTNLQLNFHDFMLFDSENLNVVVRGTGSISGLINDLLIAGNVYIPKCKLQYLTANDFTKDEDIVIENEKHIDKNKTTSQKDASKNFAKFNVNMRCSNITFKGDIFEMKLAGDLRLLTYQNQTSLAGALKLFDGHLNLFEKRMKFTDGFATFSEENPFNPRAYFICEKNFGDMGIRLTIRNSPIEGGSFDLSSSPSYSQDVILSKMLFGKETKYLSVSEAAQLAHALASLKQNGYVFSALNTFRKLGVIDSIAFLSDTNNSSTLNVNTKNNKTNKANIRAGKYIHDNIFISVNNNAEGDTSFDVDFALTDKISLKANTNGEAGVSWKYRY